MVATKERTTNGKARADYLDFHHTGPGTLAGRYMRMFWQPVYHSDDLPAGHAKPVRLLGEDFTLFRGESGTPHLVGFRCAHRGMQLSPGWIEGDCIRCFYHGWKYDGSGQCVEQPAEPKPFSQKVRIASYPTREYLGLVFAYLGEGEPPPFPRYPDFEECEGLLELDSYFRACNYFNNLENSVDSSHVAFVHGAREGSFDGLTNRPTIQAVESEWGMTNVATLSDGRSHIIQFGMPNMLHLRALPNDTEVKNHREFLVWWVPIDDQSHTQFGLYEIRVTSEIARRYVERRDARLAARTIPKEVFAKEILAGRTRLEDVDSRITDVLRLEDDIAQIGQGVIANHRNDWLGRSDAGIILIRKLWRRELQALAQGRPTKQWTYDPETQPVTWYNV